VTLSRNGANETLIGSHLYQLT